MFTKDNIFPVLLFKYILKILMSSFNYALALRIVQEARDMMNGIYRVKGSKGFRGIGSATVSLNRMRQAHYEKTRENVGHTCGGTLTHQGQWL